MKTKIEIIKEAQKTVKHSKYASIVSVYLLIVAMIYYQGNGQPNKMSALMLICSILCFINRLINDAYLWYLREELDELE